MELTDRQAEFFFYIATELAKGEAPSNTTIAFDLGGQPTAAGHIVKRLVTAKLLTRTRTRRLRLTKLGRNRAIDLCISPASSPAEERAQTVKHLKKMGYEVLAEDIRTGTQWEACGCG